MRMPKAPSPYATWAYSWRRPPSRSRRMTRDWSSVAGDSAVRVSPTTPEELPPDFVQRVEAAVGRSRAPGRTTHRGWPGAGRGHEGGDFRTAVHAMPAARRARSRRGRVSEGCGPSRRQGRDPVRLFAHRFPFRAGNDIGGAGGGTRLINRGVRQITRELPLVRRLSRGSHGVGVMKRHQASCGWTRLALTGAIRTGEHQSGNRLSASAGSLPVTRTRRSSAGHAAALRRPPST